MAATGELSQAASSIERTRVVRIGRFRIRTIDPISLIWGLPSHGNMRRLLQQGDLSWLNGLSFCRVILVTAPNTQHPIPKPLIFLTFSHQDSLSIHTTVWRVSKSEQPTG